MSSEPVTIRLTHDQALVLFEWLSREDNKQSLPMVHPAEKQVLWKVEGKLEKVLVEIFQPDYGEAVAAARERLMKEA